MKAMPDVVCFFFIARVNFFLLAVGAFVIISGLSHDSYACRHAQTETEKRHFSIVVCCPL